MKRLNEDAAMKSIEAKSMFIDEIQEIEKQIKVRFDDEKIVWYQYSELDQLEHAYAITVHKAQRK